MLFVEKQHSTRKFLSYNFALKYCNHRSLLVLFKASHSLTETSRLDSICISNFLLHQSSQLAGVHFFNSISVIILCGTPVAKFVINAFMQGVHLFFSFFFFSFSSDREDSTYMLVFELPDQHCLVF